MKVILVDEHDNATGVMDKMEAHQKGVLHRAFSILVFNSKRELLLQKRAKHKYHSGGLCTNSCCSHPAPNESLQEATKSRLQHEMGIDTQPEFLYKFKYKCKLDKDLIEHELDHVYTAVFDGVPKINEEEVEDWKFVSVEHLQHDLRQHPDQYTVWFKLIMMHPALKEVAA